MGLHYQLEDTEFGLCFDCGLVIEGGSAGCATYKEEALQTLRNQGVSDTTIDAFSAAYKIQHYNYLDLEETEAVALLGQIDDYLRDDEEATMLTEDKEEYFRSKLFQPTHSPVSLVQILAAETNEAAEALIEEYMHDIFDVYRLVK